VDLRLASLEVAGHLETTNDWRDVDNDDGDIMLTVMSLTANSGNVFVMVHR
jgi:hypothetical protein